MLAFKIEKDLAVEWKPEEVLIVVEDVPEAQMKAGSKIDAKQVFAFWPIEVIEKAFGVKIVEHEGFSIWDQIPEGEELVTGSRKIIVEKGEMKPVQVTQAIPIVPDNTDLVLLLTTLADEETIQREEAARQYKKELLADRLVNMYPNRLTFEDALSQIDSFSKSQKTELEIKGLL